MVTFPPDEVSATGDVRKKESGLATTHCVCNLKIKKMKIINDTQTTSVRVKIFFINDLLQTSSTKQRLTSSSVSTMHLLNILGQEGAILSTDLV